MHTPEKQLLRRIRLIVLFFIAALTLSGVTAFPLASELTLLCSTLGIDGSLPPSTYTGLRQWIATVNQGMVETQSTYPFMMYGTDWLAFAHLVIAVAFIGLYRDPVRNKWLICFGMIACAGVVPLALICGAVRHIPLYWRLVDCSFGVFGMIPLWWLHILVKRLERFHAENEAK